jgi:hypothetical protein
MIPKMLNGVKVWRLSRPWNNLNFLLLKPVPGLLGCMLGVIILLK